MKKQLALAVALAAASTSAAAYDKLSHSYVEAGFVHNQSELPVVAPSNISVEDMKANGGFINGSFAVGEKFYVFGGYSKAKDDSVGIRVTGLGQVGEFEVDAQQGHAGIGYNHKLSDRVEWTGEVSYLRTKFEVETRGFRDSAEGDDYRASIGLRGNLAANFEGWIKANYTDGDMYDKEFSGTLGGLIKFNDSWGVVAEADLGSDQKQYRVGVRWSF
ncbi:outer membrane beta-barrel protein [Lysobacter enzymogenes]|uniref:outer membrane beta-barrel protein n=1 Tax=Lysobacter enzymogenes TaxID=69 RepID=UPI00384AC3A7